MHGPQLTSFSNILCIIIMAMEEFEETHIKVLLVMAEFSKKCVARLFDWYNGPDCCMLWENPWHI